MTWILAHHVSFAPQGILRRAHYIVTVHALSERTRRRARQAATIAKCAHLAPSMMISAQPLRVSIALRATSQRIPSSATVFVLRELMHQHARYQGLIASHVMLERMTMIVARPPPASGAQSLHTKTSQAQLSVSTVQWVACRKLVRSHWRAVVRLELSLKWYHVH